MTTAKRGKMLKLPLVSFVVTSFNYEKFIQKTLESIISQTYENFEIIIVDDCSQDKSVEICEKFIACNQDKRITLIKHEENKGQLAAMLTGLKAANGQFVSFIDSDDILLPDYAKAHIKVHMVTSVAFTSSLIAEIDENDNIHTIYSVASPQKQKHFNIKNLDELFKFDVDHPDFKLLKAHFGGWFWSPNSSAMFRKSSIELLLKYENTDKWRICPDKFLFNFAHLIGGSAIIYEPLTAHRRHRDNAGNSSYICGNTKYNNDFVTFTNIINNINVRPETLKFIFENRKDFVKLYGKKNTVNLFLTVLFSYLYLLKQFISRSGT